MARKTTAGTIAGLIFIILFVIGVVQIPSKQKPNILNFPSISSVRQISPSVTVQKQMVKIFLVALNDDGKSGIKVGCGDSLVAVNREISPTKAVLKASLESLFLIKNKSYGQSGLYNALYNSKLKVDRAEIADGKATVYISGTVSLGGVCDNPRFEEQIKSTVLQFPTVKEASIFINNKPLKDFVSEK